RGPPHSPPAPRRPAPRPGPPGRTRGPPPSFPALLLPPRSSGPEGGCTQRQPPRAKRRDASLLSWAPVSCPLFSARRRLHPATASPSETAGRHPAFLGSWFLPSPLGPKDAAPNDTPPPGERRAAS